VAWGVEGPYPKVMTQAGEYGPPMPYVLLVHPGLF
jgi:hypothetical protein